MLFRLRLRYQFRLRLRSRIRFLGLLEQLVDLPGPPLFGLGFFPPSHTPGSWFLVPGSLFLVPGSWFLVPGSWFLVPGSWFLPLLLLQVGRRRHEGRARAGSPGDVDCLATGLQLPLRPRRLGPISGDRYPGVTVEPLQHVGKDIAPGVAAQQQVQVSVVGAHAVHAAGHDQRPLLYPLQALHGLFHGHRRRQRIPWAAHDEGRHLQGGHVLAVIPLLVLGLEGVAPEPALVLLQFPG